MLLSRSTNSLSELICTASNKVGSEFSWTLSEFRQACLNLRLNNLSDDEIRVMFTALDTEGLGKLTKQKLRSFLLDPLRPAIKSIINIAFKKLDRNGLLYVTTDDLVNSIDSSFHPDVVSGRKSEPALIKELLKLIKGEVSIS